METDEIIFVTEEVESGYHGYGDPPGGAGAPPVGPHPSPVTVDEETNRKRRPRGHGDPDRKGKRPRPAYLHYYTEAHARVRRQHPELPRSEINRRVSEGWRRLAVGERRVYLQRAHAERERSSVPPTLGAAAPSPEPPASTSLPGFRRILPRRCGGRLGYPERRAEHPGVCATRGPDCGGGVRRHPVLDRGGQRPPTPAGAGGGGRRHGDAAPPAPTPRGGGHGGGGRPHPHAGVHRQAARTAGGGGRGPVHPGAREQLHSGRAHGRQDGRKVYVHAPRPGELPRRRLRLRVRDPAQASGLPALRHLARRQVGAPGRGALGRRGTQGGPLRRRRSGGSEGR